MYPTCEGGVFEACALLMRGLGSEKAYLVVRTIGVDSSVERLLWYVNEGGGVAIEFSSA